MTPTRLALGAAGVLVIAAYAVLAVRWTSAGSAWAARLERPPWQPPDVVFGVVWPLNFVAMTVAVTAVAATAPVDDAVTWLVVFVTSVGFALGWARAFYVHHHLGAAAVLLLAAAALTWWLLVLTVGLLGWAGTVLVPYALWLSVASSLAVGYHHLGSRAGAARP